MLPRCLFSHCARTSHLERLEDRQMLSATGLSVANLPATTPDGACYFSVLAPSLQGHGDCTPKDVPLEALWQETAERYLLDDLWQDAWAYDAAHYLMVPLHAAFEMNRPEWQAAFSDHFRRFVVHEASLPQAPESSLARTQYLYLASRFISLAETSGRSELIPPELIATVYDAIDRMWRREPAWQWAREPFPGGIQQRLAWKLATPETAVSYHRAVIDEEQFLFGMAADLHAYLRATHDATLQGGTIREILDAALQVYQQEVVELADGRWLFQPGVWTDHFAYAHAGHTEIVDPMTPDPVPEVAEDTSHATRRPLILRSLAEAYDADAVERTFYNQRLAGLEKQFVEQVLVPPDEAFPAYRTTNFMDGHNGVYRWNYDTHRGDGYGPYELSGTLHLAWWAFLGSERIRAVYREIAGQFPLASDQLETFLGPGTSRERHPLVRSPADYENGMLEFIAILAGTSSGWTPRVDRLPAEVAIAPGDEQRVDLRTIDPDGEAVAVDAWSVSREYAYDQALQLRAAESYFEDWGGAGEKWMTNSAGAWYFVRPDGAFYRWDYGAAATGERIAHFGPEVHADPALLHDARFAPGRIDASIVGDELLLDADEEFAGTTLVFVQLADEQHVALESFAVTAARAPRLSFLHEPILVEGQTTQLATNVVGGELNADDVSVHLVSLAYAVDRQLRLASVEDAYENWGGRGERWIRDADRRWYFLTPAGDLYRWDRSALATGQLVARLGAEVYATPAMLVDASAAEVGEATYDPTGRIATAADARAGEVVVLQTSYPADSKASIHWTPLTVWGDWPEAPLEALVLPSVALQGHVALPVSNVSGPAHASYQARAHSLLYRVDQQYGLDLPANLYEDWGGQGEKWLLGRGAQWYFVTPDGDFYRWDGQPTATGTLLERLSPQVHATPELLTDARPGTTLGEAVALGNLLVVRAEQPAAGRFAVEVIASGAASTSGRWFDASVNVAPQLAPIADQALAADLQSTVVDLDIDDPDDQAHVATVEVQSLAAYWGERLGLAVAGSLYADWGGRGEKWLLGADRQWYFIVPDGRLYRWDRSDQATGEVIASLSPEVHLAPEQLYLPGAAVHSLHDVPSGGSLLIELPGDAVQTMVTVVVADQFSSAEQRFLIVRS